LPYAMEGQFLEACDCAVPCPCWFDRDPHEGECTGLLAWHIEQGTIDGVDVSGLTAVSVSSHSGHRAEAVKQAKMRIRLFVNAEASDKQQRAVERAFTGALGGPLGELAEMTDAAPGIERAPIAYSTGEGSTRLIVGSAAEAAMSTLVGSTQRVMTIRDSVLATLLGRVGEVGQTDRFALDLADESVSVELKGSSATRGRFSYSAKR
jgi:hypothetical protein